MLQQILLSLIVIVATFSGASGVALTVSSTDTTATLRLLERGSVYISKSVVEKRNLDSAIILSSQALRMSEADHFVRGVRKARFIEGLAYIKGKNDSELKKLFTIVEKEDRIQLIIEWIKFRTVITGIDRTANFKDTLLVYAKQALDYGRDTHSRSIVSLSLQQLSNIYYETGDVEKGKEYFVKAVREVRQGEDIKFEAEIFAQASGNLLVDGSALSTLDSIGKHSLEIYNGLKPSTYRNDLQELIVMGYSSITFYFINRGDFTKALSYNLKTVRLLEKEGNTLNNEMPYISISKIYFELNKMEECIKYSDKAAATAKQKGELAHGLILKTAVRAFIALNRPQDGLRFIYDNIDGEDFRDHAVIPESIGNCYLAMKEFGKAEQYYLQSLNIAKRQNATSQLIAYVPLGRLYTQTGQFDKATIYLNELTSDQNKSIIPIPVQRDAHMMLFKADSVSKNYLAAIDHLHHYQSMNDFIFSEKQTRQIEEMKAIYETDKKDHDIKLLTSQGELKELELSQARFMRNAFIAGAVLLITLLGLLYGRFRLKQNTNELLQLKQKHINQSNEQLITLNEDLKKLLDEKEWLVKEIHHRVKNNLQVIVSLLNTQAAHLSEGEALEAIRDSQLRMQVISLLHQKLYQVDNSNIVDMKVYIPELVTYIRESHKGINHLYFELIIDSIQLDISQAVPIGLILNEAITNAIKHGFRQSEKGIVRILFEEGADRDVLLTISDNGSGLPGDFEVSRKSSLGMRLMETLSEQVGGSMSIGNSNGTTIKIAFEQAIDDQTKYALRKARII